MPTVEISFAALPAHVRTARLIAVAVARRAHVADDVLDELRLAVGEACSRAVALHQEHAPDALVQMLLDDDRDSFSVEVVDVAPSDHFPSAMDALAASVERSTLDDSAAEAHPADPLPPGFGLAVIAGLVEDVEVTAAGRTGTRVRMSWPAGDQAGESLAAAEG